MTARARRQQVRFGMRLAMALFYFGAGMLHILSTDTFVAIVPSWVPSARVTVLVTGCCELVGACALLSHQWRKAAGLMLALYAICVFPANIVHAAYGIPVDGHILGWAYHAPRLAFQPVLVWWALFCSDVVDWPLRPLPHSKNRDSQA